MVILASASPRRRRLLKLIFPRFSVRPGDCDENNDRALPPEKLVEELARRKAAAAVLKAEADDLIVAADTVVAVDGMILGKPADERDAFRMLRLLSGRAHVVHTGVAVVKDGVTRSFVESAEVMFRPLSDRQIGRYIATGEPMDKAGAYGVQEKGALLVEGIRGDFYTVMGLPVCGLARRLEEWGIGPEGLDSI